MNQRTEMHRTIVSRNIDSHFDLKVECLSNVHIPTNCIVFGSLCLFGVGQFADYNITTCYVVNLQHSYVVIFLFAIFYPPNCSERLYVQYSIGKGQNPSESWSTPIQRMISLVFSAYNEAYAYVVSPNPGRWWPEVARSENFLDATRLHIDPRRSTKR